MRTGKMQGRKFEGGKGLRKVHASARITIQTQQTAPDDKPYISKLHAAVRIYLRSPTQSGN